jgi:putative IMPACT (imprinted ancient) family translation regulator
MCLGYIALSAGMTERCYDDDEPPGTSGVLILSAIRGQGPLDTLCVVVRYYGRIKLGEGGLIRAYGTTAPAPQAQLDEI